jgi:hypothetical protein
MSAPGLKLSRGGRGLVISYSFLLSLGAHIFRVFKKLFLRNKLK